jgi:hypothetical protein
MNTESRPLNSEPLEKKEKSVLPKNEGCCEPQWKVDSAFGVGFERRTGE